MYQSKLNGVYCELFEFISFTNKKFESPIVYGFG